jgi:hypothetical protein
MIISLWIRLRMGSVLGKYRGNRTLISSSISPPSIPPEDHVGYEKMWKKQNVFSRFHCNTANVSVPQCHVVRKLPIILRIITSMRLEKLMRHGLRATIAAVQTPAIAVFPTCYNNKKCCILIMLCLVWHSQSIVIISIIRINCFFFVM